LASDLVTLAAVTEQTSGATARLGICAQLLVVTTGNPPVSGALTYVVCIYPDDRADDDTR
jgi:hypothetical protein